VSTGVFNAMVTRQDASPLIPTEEAKQIIKQTTQASVALSLFKRVPMSSKQFTQPVLASLAQAYWVNGDTGLKQTTDLMWSGLNLTAEEIAVIVPVPDAVIADAAFPVWAEVRQAVAEAIGAKLDAAVFAGIDKPASWPTAIVPAAVAAGNEVTMSADAAAGGVADDLSLLFDAVENDGFDVTAVAAKRSLRSLLRRARDTSGQKLADVSTTSILEAPVSYLINDTVDDTTLAVAGQFDMALIGIRQDLTWKILDQAVLTDDTGKVIVNLSQQDSTAMRVVARYAFQVARPVTRPEGSPADANLYPFAVLHPTAVTP
jgi:HK97 family phage major capsid protein